MVYNEHERAILTTLHYSALFDFPLTKNELWKYLMNEKKVQAKANLLNYKDFIASLVDLHRKKLISFESGYYCLFGREKMIAIREKRSLEAQKKLQLAQEATSMLTKIPTICLIGLSGGLAMDNTDADDDIDLFIITRKNTLFVTRLLILSILEMKGLRRKRNEINPKNKICVNLLIDETALVWQPEQRDIFTAHEIVQLKPMFDRNNTYQRFLAANHWISQFLPNALYNSNQELRIMNHGVLSSVIPDSLSIIREVIVDKLLVLSLFESSARKLQMQVIRHHQTSEEITNSRLAFHPYNYRSNFIDKLNLNLEKAGLLTKI